MLKGCKGSCVFRAPHFWKREWLRLTKTHCTPPLPKTFAKQSKQRVGRWDRATVSNTLPFWQTLDTHRGPGHLSRRWHSSCRGRRTASSSGRSWPAPAPCVGNHKRVVSTSSVQGQICCLSCLCIVGGGAGGGFWAGDGKCFRFKQVESATAALCSLIPTRLHTCHLASCCASHFSQLDTRLTKVCLSCTKIKNTCCAISWEAMFNVWCQKTIK